MKKYIRRYIALLAVSILAMPIISACGGNGGLDNTLWTPPPAQEFIPGTHVVIVPGYIDNITVQTTFNTDGIVSVYVLDHNETPMFFDMVMPGLAERIVAANTYSVDSVVNATVTADAIMDAVRIATDIALGRQAFIITVPGYIDDITVRTVFDADVIVGVYVVSHNETPMFFDMVMPDLGERIVAANTYNVDSVVNATVTADAIMDAVRIATDVAQGRAPMPTPAPTTPAPTPAPTPEPTPAPTPEPTPEPTPQPTPEPTPEPTIPTPTPGPDATPEPTPAPTPEPTPAPTPTPTPARFNPGSHTVSVDGYIDSITVRVTFDANRITDITVVDHDETPMFFDMVMPGLGERILAAQTYDVDTVARATVTADAIIEAVRIAMGRASVN